MNNLGAFVKGSAVAFLGWVLLTLADIFDEKILRKEAVVSIYLIVLIPIILYVLFIVYTAKKRPAGSDVVMWLTGYGLAGALVGGIIVWLLYRGMYFASVECLGCWLICFNGTEYYVFGIMSMGGFLVLSIVYYLIYFLVTRNKN